MLQNDSVLSSIGTGPSKDEPGRTVAIVTRGANLVLAPRRVAFAKRFTSVGEEVAWHMKIDWKGRFNHSAQSFARISSA